MKKFILLPIAIFIFWCACKQPAKKNIVTQSIEKELPKSILQLDTTLQTIDSIVFVFYNDPFSKDSLRYTRFYKQYNVVDTATLGFVQSQLNDTIVKIEKVKPCRSQGKIWCFSKKDILQTIYFSSYNDNCSHIYIIKNGFFYYTSISDAFIDKLKNIKPLATTPN